MTGKEVFDAICGTGGSDGFNILSASRLRRKNSFGSYTSLNSVQKEIVDTIDGWFEALDELEKAGLLPSGVKTRWDFEKEWNDDE